MAEERHRLGLNPAEVIGVLEKAFFRSFGLKDETAFYFRLGTEVPGLTFQFHYLPRSPRDETAPSRWQEQQEDASRNGLRLVHIWEDQWKRQRQIVLPRLGSMLGQSLRIHGRETLAGKVDAATARRFFGENHLLVPLSGRHRFGLFYKQELVSLAAFSGARIMKSKSPAYRSFELLRFCHAGSRLVVGGLSKLLAAFAETFHPEDIMTYIDLDWSEGGAFLNTGFLPSGKTPPQVFWINPEEGIRYYPGRLPAGLGEAAPEQLQEAGYFRIYNCGSLKLLKQFGAEKER
ncbi:MAG TPA: hypothetical protein VD772_00440 [Anseongella sp.]|nr:hypothetical protein [Anseongella sp.]